MLWTEYAYDGVWKLEHWKTWNKTYGLSTSLPGNVSTHYKDKNTGQIESPKIYWAILLILGFSLFITRLSPKKLLLILPVLVLRSTCTSNTIVQVVIVLYLPGISKPDVRGSHFIFIMSYIFVVATQWCNRIY